MGTWAITDPKADRIYGTVEADTYRDATRAATSQGEDVQWFWKAEPGPNTQLAVHAVETLVDGKWRELGVTTPGGDVLPEQVGESVQRRYGLPKADGTWAVYTATWYVVEYGDCYTDERRNAVRLERQEEFLISTDVHQPGDTYTFEDMSYRIEQGWAAEVESLPYVAADFDPDAEITWTGRIPRGRVSPARR